MKEQNHVPSEYIERVIHPIMARVDGRVTALLNAPIWTHEGESHDMNRERWLQHGKDVAYVAALYFIDHPEALPKDASLELVLFGFVIHDIGKAEVSADPYVWHRKRSDLSLSELSALQSHVATGMELIDRYEYIHGGQALPQIVKDIVVKHHEKMDGSGNPRGLTATDLSPAVRLATIIDQVISRCEPRAYHDRTYTLREAFEEVSEGKGVAYDASILENLRAIFESGAHLEIPSLGWLGSFT